VKSLFFGVLLGWSGSSGLGGDVALGGCLSSGLGGGDVGLGDNWGHWLAGSDVGLGDGGGGLLDDGGNWLSSGAGLGGGDIGRGLLLEDIGRLLLGLLGSPLVEELVILVNGLSGLEPSVLLFLLVYFLASESAVGDQSLDLGSLISLLSAGGGPSSSDGNLLGEGRGGSLLSSLDSEQLPQLGGSLGSQPSGLGVVGESLDLEVALLDDGHSQDSNIGVDNASSNTLPLSLSSPSGSIAGVSLAHEHLGTALGDDTLLHGESLLIVSSSDLEDVPSVLVSQVVSLDLLSDSLIEEDGAFLVVIDIDALLGPV